MLSQPFYYLPQQSVREFLLCRKEENEENEEENETEKEDDEENK